MDSRQILNVRVDAVTYENAAAHVMHWAGEGRSCYVCLANVNTVMEARASREYQDVMRQADLVTSDGMPLVWLLRWLGASDATRVYGPDLMPLILAAAEQAGDRCRILRGLGFVASKTRQRCHQPFSESKAAVRLRSAVPATNARRG